MVADRVIAGNSTLADYASQVAKDVVVTPSCVEPGRYQRKDNFDVAARPLLGWIGSPSTEPYLAAIGSALQEVHRRTGARVQLVGSERRFGASGDHDRPHSLVRAGS